MTEDEIPEIPDHPPTDWEHKHPEDTMINALVRIARDLERVLIGIAVASGFLGALFFLVLLRTLIGR